MQVYRLHSPESISLPASVRGKGDGNSTASASGMDSTEVRLGTTGSEVAVLTTQLRKSPEVRQEVVDQARAKFARGEYFTRSSAEATAGALQSLESSNI